MEFGLMPDNFMEFKEELRSLLSGVLWVYKVGLKWPVIAISD